MSLQKEKLNNVIVWNFPQSPKSPTRKTPVKTMTYTTQHTQSDNNCFPFCLSEGQSVLQATKKENLPSNTLMQYITPNALETALTPSKNWKKYFIGASTIASATALFFLSNDISAFASNMTPTMTLPTTSTTDGIQIQDGLFWDIFMTYIYPWFVDVAQVFCAIKIAQAFYEENRGGRDSGSGVTAIVSYGKWLLLFHMIPFAVSLLNEVGQRMADSIGG